MSLMLRGAQPVNERYGTELSTLKCTYDASSQMSNLESLAESMGSTITVQNTTKTGMDEDPVPDDFE